MDMRSDVDTAPEGTESLSVPRSEVHGSDTLSTTTGRTIEDRLAALLQMIRSWDWRAAAHTSEPGHEEPTSPTAPGPAPAVTTPAEPSLPSHPPRPEPTWQPLPRSGTEEAGQSPRNPSLRPPWFLPPWEPSHQTTPGTALGEEDQPRIRPSEGPSNLDLAALDLAAQPRNGRTESGSESIDLSDPPASPSAATSFLTRPLSEPDFDFGPAENPSNLTSPFKRRFLRSEEEPSLVQPEVIKPDSELPAEEQSQVHQVEADPATATSSRRFVKPILIAVTILIVIGIVAIIRASASNPDSSGSLTPTSVTHQKSAPPAPTIAVSSSIKSAFAAASSNLNAANVTVAHALAAGANQTPTQVAQEVGPYVTALNTFIFHTHFLAWPATLQVPGEDLTLRTQDLIHLLSSVSSVSPTTLSSWFAQFHALSSSAQTADNLLRKDIGLSPASSFST
jgi:hypothetical protein